MEERVNSLPFWDIKKKFAVQAGYQPLIMFDLAKTTGKQGVLTLLTVFAGGKPAATKLSRRQR